MTTQCIDWKLAISGVPSLDRLKGLDLEELPDLGDAVDNFIHEVTNGRYAAWEAVIREEQGLPLTERQRFFRDRLFAFPDSEDDEDDEEEADDRILTIDEMERPAEPWYETLRKIASHLLVDEFRTAEPQYAVIVEGWDDMMEALDEHGESLSLPESAASPEEVVPPDLRHRLWLQTCFDSPEGLGQEGVLPLENPDEHWRVEEFVESLKLHEESVRYLGLTLEGLLKVLILPDRDRKLFVQMFMDAVGIRSMADPIADYL